VRRAAIEILNQTKDERAVAFLIEATRTTTGGCASGPWTRWARSAVARRCPPLLDLLDRSDDRSLPTVIRAIGKLGDTGQITRLLPLLDHSAKEVRLEAITAPDAPRRRPLVRRGPRAPRSRELRPCRRHDQPCGAARVQDLDSRFSSGAVAVRDDAARMAEPSRTLLVERADIEGMMRKSREQARLDISTLKPGDVLEGRYKVRAEDRTRALRHCAPDGGHGGDERLILKFLNPNVSQDEEMMKRFVHELRYSRRSLTRNVIRIYDFLSIRGNYAISMDVLPVAHARQRGQ